MRSQIVLGFMAASSFGISAAHNVPDKVFMAMELRDGALENLGAPPGTTLHSKPSDGSVYTWLNRIQGAHVAQDDQKIDYVEFTAADFDAVQAFYEKAFGWTFVDYGPEYRAFNDGKLDGGFRQGDGKATSAAGSALVILYADDLEATRDKVIASGGEITEDIFSFPGGRRFQFTDPHGNELAVWSQG